jgi:hypothetical protein
VSLFPVAVFGITHAHEPAGFRLLSASLAVHRFAAAVSPVASETRTAPTAKRSPAFGFAGLNAAVTS